jgi:hypothetical protein
MRTAPRTARSASRFCGGTFLMSALFCFMESFENRVHPVNAYIGGITTSYIKAFNHRVHGVTQG